MVRALEHYRDKLLTPLSITFAFVATHNHFVFDRGGKVFNRSAPVIKLQSNATEDDHLSLLGLLNSSDSVLLDETELFHNKGSGRNRWRRSATRQWETSYEFDGHRASQLSGAGVATSQL